MTRYEIVIGNTMKTVDLEHFVDQTVGTETYQCQIIGEKGNIRKLVVQRRDSHILLVSLDDKMYSVRQTKRTALTVDFILNGRRVHAHFPSEVGREETGVKSDIASVNELVSSNFPAKVVSIKASKGGKLKEGDTLLVLEAMKMEAQIKAPKNCEVVEVFVHEGEIVPRGTKLVQLKFT
ncbi:MAG: hypothetical protein PXY39_02390 [archaeon]|nr:hypothetical protein [archaeon]